MPPLPSEATPFLQPLALVAVWTGVGWLSGLILNRVAYQLPRERSLLEAPTCDACGTGIPILRFRRATCSACGADRAPERAEWLTGALFGALSLHLGAGLPLLIRSLYSLVLVAIAVIDWRHRLVFGVMTYPSILVALALSVALPGLSVGAAVGGLAVGLLAFGALYAGGRLLYRGQEPMGFGDVAIAGVVGAMTGFPIVLAALFSGSIAVAVMGLVGIATGRARRGTFIPYGPGLCFGGLVSFFAS